METGFEKTIYEVKRVKWLSVFSYVLISLFVSYVIDFYWNTGRTTYFITTFITPMGAVISDIISNTQLVSVFREEWGEQSRVFHVLIVIIILCSWYLFDQISNVIWRTK